jgi:hypothetical protein
MTLLDRMLTATGARDRPGKTNGKEIFPSPLSTYSALGVLRQDPCCAAQSPAEARTCANTLELAETQIMEHGGFA